MAKIAIFTQIRKTSTDEKEARKISNVILEEREIPDNLLDTENAILLKIEQGKFLGEFIALNTWLDQDVFCWVI